MIEVVIVAAKRTPQGKFLGALSRQSAVDLAVAAGSAAIEAVDAEAVDQVILGNVLGAGQGMNPARQVGVRLGLPIECPAFTVNTMCASGMQAVMLAGQAILSGQSRVVLCGGSESMSNAPHLLDRARSGYKLGNGILIDSLLRDGLTDSFDDEHMGQTAERLAREYSISRSQQDDFAARSQHRYQQARAGGVFDDEQITMAQLEQDEHPRADTTAEGLNKLKPVFNPEGSVTAGNAAGINDGAAMLVLCDRTIAEERGWTPLARMSAWATVGCDPKRMGLGPFHATKQLCQRQGWSLDRFDTIELNEAFAAQALTCLQLWGLPEDTSTVNPHGGAIALGHPIGASGARLLAHLSHEAARGQVKHGLATLCVGGGMGGAVAIESI